MAQKVIVIHTGPVTVQPLMNLKKELLPDTEWVNIMDDSLLKDVMKAGEVTPEVRKRMAGYMMMAEQMGAKAILNACSSVGEAADYIQGMISIPIVKIDNRMAEQAVELGKKIGVLATVKTTLDPTVRLIEKKAREKGTDIVVERFLCSEAFEALLKGDGKRHDQLLIQAVEEMGERNDVLVLAQVSMARLVDSLPEMKVPVLSSPRPGMMELAETLGRLQRS